MTEGDTDKDITKPVDSDSGKSRLDIYRQHYLEVFRPHTKSELDAYAISSTMASIAVTTEELTGHKVHIGDDFFDTSLEANHNLVVESSPKLDHRNYLLDLIWTVRRETNEKIFSPRELLTNPKVPKKTKEEAMKIMQEALLKQDQEVPVDSDGLVDAYLKIVST
ncbi:MAG: hypothetical protein M1426_00595 [Patescibacteria group bacterium]|nr:hypothetical protein [Patescibacteria group bacterium]